jgi:cell division protein FtsW
MKSEVNISKNWLNNSKSNHHIFNSDTVILLIVLALSSIGIIMVYSSSYIYALDKFKDGNFFLKRHIFTLALGFLAFFIGSNINLNLLKKHAPKFLILSIFLLLLTLIPGLAPKTGGASRWLKIGSFSFQPSEFAKLAIIIFTSMQITKKQFNLKPYEINYRSGFLTYFFTTAPVFLLLLLQPDFGTTALCVITILFILIVNQIRLRYIIPSILVLAVLAGLLILIAPYRLKRVTTFLNPWADPTNKGFQVIQSFLAFYSGKFSGVGLGNSKEKLFYLPEAHNDFIFAVIGEELGFIGVSLVILLFSLLIFRGLSLLKHLDDPFKKSLCTGIISMIGTQAYFNMAVVLGLLPTKGLPLPLISYGGTSIIITLFMLGILSKISIETKS